MSNSNSDPSDLFDPPERVTNTREPLPDVRYDADTGDRYVPLPTTLCLLVERTLSRRERGKWVDYFLKFEAPEAVESVVPVADAWGTLRNKRHRVRTALTQVCRTVEDGMKRGARWYSSRSPLQHRIFARLVFYSYRAADLPEGKLRGWASRRGSAIAQWGELSVIDLLAEVEQD